MSPVISFAMNIFRNHTYAACDCEITVGKEPVEQMLLEQTIKKRSKSLRIKPIVLTLILSKYDFLIIDLS